MTAAAFTFTSPPRAPAPTGSPSEGRLARWRRQRNSCSSWLKRRSENRGEGTCQSRNCNCSFIRFQQVNNFTAELQAKPEYHKFLIGRGGANIRRVRDRTGARIIFPSPDDTEQELITIVGKEEAVRQAQKELENLVKNLVILNSEVSLVFFS